MFSRSALIMLCHVGGAFLSLPILSCTSLTYESGESLCGDIQRSGDNKHNSTAAPHLYPKSELPRVGSKKDLPSRRFACLAPPPRSASHLRQARPRGARGYRGLGIRHSGPQRQELKTKKSSIWASSQWSVALNFSSRNGRPAHGVHKRLGLVPRP
jgi:hypothetical protein